MCLAIPMRVKKIEGSFAEVRIGNMKRRVNIDMLPGLKAGDFVMVHAGFGIQKVDKEEAKKTLEAIRQLNEVR